MIMLVARPPLYPLPMSTIQRPARRLSARILEKDDVTLQTSHAQTGGKVKTTASTSNTTATQDAKANERKRKMAYDEEDDGFLFKRVKKKPDSVAAKKAESEALVPANASDSQHPANGEAAVPTKDDAAPVPKPRRKKMTFSTPKPKDDPPRRRSERLSKDSERADDSPVKKAARTQAASKPPAQPIISPSKQSANKAARTETAIQSPARPTTVPQKASPAKAAREDVTMKQFQETARLPPKELPKRPPKEPVKQIVKVVPAENTQDVHQTEVVPTSEESHSATRIALHLADTPVIRRNKAMREGKGGKSERRSSLGSRGRRASSLIESGNSNALPHAEVDVADYYKHIESDGLPEPRRMKQLLTWCAERALDEKPTGTSYFEDSHARQAARVIEEELLKELSSKSDLSDWFAREDVPVPKEPLPERPNPKNVQNMEKIRELEEQIQRLRIEKEALESFLRPPSLTSLPQHDSTKTPSKIDRSLLSETGAAALDLMASKSNPTSSDQISRRVNALLDSIGPTIDQFADGVHRIGQYRTAADKVAGKVLAICAEKITEREKEGRKRVLSATDQTQPQETPPKDLGSVLRSLSRADR